MTAKKKIIFTGDPGVGKTALFMRIKEEMFGVLPTVGIESCSKDVTVNNQTVQVRDPEVSLSLLQCPHAVSSQCGILPEPSDFAH